MMFFKTHRGQIVLNFIFAFFAAVVILGALFKIRHWPYADEMITIGLLSEVIVFLVMAFMVPPPEEPHWQRYFPDINLHPDLDPNFKPTPLALANDSSPLKSMDDMLSEAGINSDSLGKLSTSLNKLEKTAGGISDVSDAVTATNDYTTKTREAASALAQMKDAYSVAAESTQNFNAAATDTKHFHEQVQILTKNLSALNTIYELELQDTNNHLKSMNKFYGNLVQTSDIMQGTVENAKNTQEQISILANNLSRLNQVYGNMLSAMQGRA